MAIRTVPPAPRRLRRSRRMTEAEYLALPETKPYLEFVDGEVLQKAMPDGTHGDLVGEVDGRFWHYRTTAGGRFGPERRARLREGIYRLPDTAYWSRGRASGDDSIPSVAVEVLSPHDSRTEARAKCRAYVEYGVVTAWLLDPVRRTAEIFGDGQDGAVLTPPDGVLVSSAMPGFALPLNELFSALDPER